MARIGHEFFWKNAFAKQSSSSFYGRDRLVAFQASSVKTAQTDVFFGKCHFLTFWHVEMRTNVFWHFSAIVRIKFSVSWQPKNLIFNKSFGAQKRVHLNRQKCVRNCTLINPPFGTPFWHSVKTGRKNRQESNFRVLSDDFKKHTIFNKKIKYFQ